jgi:recombination protein RecA
VNENVQALLAKFNKQLEKDGNPTLTVASEMFIPKRFTSGILSLDVATGGGWPGNQWIEVYGKESNGKTSGILHTIAANQALDPNFMTFWLASEHYDKEWAEKNGVDNDRVVVFSTTGMELAYDMIIDMARSHEFDCIVLDSYPALSPGEEQDKTMDQASMALGARLNGKFFRKIGGTFSNDRPYVGFFVNQLRDAIGSFSPYGTPTTTPGGKAKNYAFYQRVLVSRDEWIEEKHEGLGKVKVGQAIKFKMEKNKAAAPQTVARTDFYFENSVKGFSPGQHDSVKDIVTMAVAFKVIRRGGAWYNYATATGEEFKWQGLESMVTDIRSNLELQAEITRVTLEIATQ